MNIAKLKTKAEGLVTQLTAKDDCERVVLDAMSNKSWAAHPTQLNEIAEWTFQYERCDQVSRKLAIIADLLCFRRWWKEPIGGGMLCALAGERFNSPHKLCVFFMLVPRPLHEYSSLDIMVAT